MVYLTGKQLSVTKERNHKTGLSKPDKNKAAARFLFMKQVFSGKLNKRFIKVAIFFICLLFFENAWAAFTISVTPYEGGSELRFGRVAIEIPQVKREVTIEVTTDVGKKYRVYQEILTPFTNTQGEVIPDESLTFYTVQGSNARGNLDAEQKQPIRGGRLLLYTSNSQGQNDSFILAYGLSFPEGKPGGTYRGRMMFTLEAVDGSQTPQKKYLNAAVTLESQAGLEVIAPGGGKTIELKAGDLLQEKNEVIFKITGNLGETYRLIQSWPEPLRAEEKELPLENIIFKVGEGKKGVVAGEENVRWGNTVLYTSNPQGEQDAVLVSYHLAEPVAAKAGTYRGRVRFFLETPRPVDIEQPNLNFLVRIEPTFELKVTPDLGGRIEFRDLKPEQPPKINEVVLEVATNQGKAYQVSQKVNSLLINQEGKVIAKEQFVFYEQKISEGGVLKQPSRVPVEVGETTLFISDENGSPAQFKIIYELSIPRDLTAGNYSSQITYSISEL